jgi:lipoprotein NlpI
MLREYDPASDPLVQEHNRAWAMVLNGEYEAAIDIFSDLEPRRPNLGTYNNRGIAYLCVGRPELAERDFRTARYIRTGPFRHVTVWVGVALWCQREQRRACEDWAAEVARRTGVIEAPALLWWASAHPELREWQPVAERELKRLWRMKSWQKDQKDYWPGPLVPLLLGHSTTDETMEAAQRAIAYGEVAARYVCHARFYAGGVSLHDGEEARYQHSMIEVARTKPRTGLLVPEYFIACAEAAAFEVDA